VPIDQRGKLEENFFSYETSKNEKVFLYWYEKQVKILSGKEAEKFLNRISGLDGIEAQLVMAKATGNFKRGNEKRGEK
jgi:hypothetical protein